jgi:putative transcriptional regulator
MRVTTRRKRRVSRLLAGWVGRHPFAGCLLAVALASSTQPVASQQPLAAQLRRGAVKELAPGKLLVSARNLPDPNFSDSVVLLADFSTEGAMGLIVNRRTEVPLAKVFPGFDHARGAQAALFFGGPVSVPGVLALVRAATAPAGSRRVFDDVHLVNTRESLEHLVKQGVGAERFRVYVGYAGWGAGQLDGETAGGAWHVFDGDPEVVFDPDPDSVWRRQIRRTESLVARSRKPEAGSRTLQAVRLFFSRPVRTGRPPGSTDPP